MKASRLIEILNDKIKTDGDLDIFCISESIDGESREVANVTTFLDNNDKPKYFHVLESSDALNILLSKRRF